MQDDIFLLGLYKVESQEFRCSLKVFKTRMFDKFLFVKVFCFYIINHKFFFLYVCIYR